MTDRASYGERGDPSHHETFLLHAGARWAWIAAFLCVLAAGGFYRLNMRTNFHQVPHTGATWFGYVSGTVGALIMLWLTTIGIRKRRISAGHWSLKAWVSAHVYLGLSLLVIVSLHTGLQFGANIHTLAYILMLLVIGSGVMGVIAYMFLPVQLSQVRGDMTREQMLGNILSLDGSILDAAQPLEGEAASIARLSLDRTILVGRLSRRLSGIYWGCGNRRALARLAALPRDLPDRQRQAAEKIRSLMERKEEILERARRYIRIRAFLEVWLYIHVPMTFAMLAALTAHIVSVFFFF